MPMSPPSLSREEIQEAMQMAINIGISNGNINRVRYETTHQLTEEEAYFLESEFRFQVAGIIGRREIKRIMEIEDGKV